MSKSRSRIIGVTLSTQLADEHRLAYIKPLLDEGAEVVVLYSKDDCRSDFQELGLNGVMLTGGGDIDPRLYGEELRDSDPPDPERDELELKLFDWAQSQELTVFGICRGLQLINVALKGSLYQDLEKELPGKVLNHRSLSSDPRHPLLHRLNRHSVKIEANSLTAKACGFPAGLVVTSHHQAVKKLAAGLRPTAFAADGTIEAAENESGNILAVQWHPERMGETGIPIYRWFINRCGERK